MGANVNISGKDHLLLQYAEKTEVFTKFTVYNYLWRERISDTRELFNLADRDITRFSGWKLNSAKFTLEIGHNFLITWIINHWNRLQGARWILFH